jgi:organic hydroperoxide reductase OsmC/OhrA
MKESPNGGGRFDEVTLHPVVTVTDESMIEKANQLHEKANELCFIARSVNFSVRHSPIAMTSKK